MHSEMGPVSTTDEIRMQTWRWTELLRILKVTSTGRNSHVVRQVLGEVCHRLDVLSGSSSQTVCRA